MIQKVKRRIILGKKNCLVCGNTFQPTSGAQKTCSPSCKEKAREQGLNKRGSRKKASPIDIEDETPLERMARLDRENPIPPLHERRKAYARDAEATGAEESRANASREVTKSPRYLDRFPVPLGSTNPQSDGATEVEEGFELDLSPLEIYIQKLVKKEVQSALKDGIKEAVREEIAERLRGLF